MDIVGILFLFFLGYRNSTRAKLKGQNRILWALATVVAFVIFESIGVLIVVRFFCSGEVDMGIFSRPITNFEAASKQFNQQVANAFIENPLRELTVFLFGIGGYLLVRYILDRKPDKKEPEVHWMDRMNDVK